jgi:hypothetical protein
MMPPLLAIVDIERKADGRMFHVWLPLFLIWLILLPIIILVLPLIFIGCLINRIPFVATMMGLLRVVSALNGTHVDIDHGRRHIVIRLV